MTSRVLDGHRKQEDLKISNWNSLMTKSERANASSKSQVSCRDRPKELGLQHMNLSNNVVTQSATFSKISKTGAILSAEAHASAGDRESVHATLGNMREMEILSMDGNVVGGLEDVRRSLNWSERSGSLKVTPKVSTSKEPSKEPGKDTPVIAIGGFFQIKHDSVPNNSQQAPDLPSNDQQPVS
mmetsp:Transcript_9296/g.12644  ORF Transcript_9296/g.12644 Transcript_9296/m.12644 type:complete len:184 (+) Transcript_9296:517-1068(+)|eukprot:CAMPEP_0185595510 /NCGR_PEP_ID=MMETSP0434-20130131/78707_1 /TAXON_ID=626734 ORGANISM="Favella taraikaensis, Strain Fe Narragansett Bay" /NCGR_SAMPLE_ID=MMETSP0434 /ASSEMBLY_ACC=CAM_ASM_000379 /LENGTH=183 /DNA_ID=CAMNT_0028223573 /DNA_START=503 /DNA_END=1054 /DNA_ORIENTATION=-